MAIITLNTPTHAEREAMIRWLVENVGPTNRARTQSTISCWGENWWMKGMIVNGALKWQVYVPDDTMAVMFRLACSN